MPPRRTYIAPSAMAEIELEYRRRIASMDVDSVRSLFQVKYWNDPAGFARDCIDWQSKSGLADYQVQGLEAIPKQRRVSMRGPHGLGKTALAAIGILWFALTRDGKDWKAVSTAGAWRQLTKYLWPEVHKWVRFLKWDMIGRRPFVHGVELLDLSLKLSTGEAFAVASDNSELIEGAHADYLFYVFDEAKTIPDSTWDAAEGAFATGDCMSLAISTPGEPQGRFYDIQRRSPGYQDWWVRKVSKEDAIKAGRMDSKWAAARKKQWGEQSAMYINRVEGEFAASDEDGIIALAWIERANSRWLELHDGEETNPEIWGALTRLGVDVGRGGDPSTIARRHGMAIRSIEEMNERDVMAVTGRVKGILDANPQADAVIDVIGIGAGVVDRLREFKHFIGRILGFNSSEHTDARDKTREIGFVNERAASWWYFREMLQDDLIDLPPDDILTGELTAPKYKQMSGGRLQVEEKAEIKKRLNRSTNYADAVIMAFWRKTGGIKDDEAERIAKDEIDVSTIPPDLLEAARMSGIDVDALIKAEQERKAKE